MLEARDIVFGYSRSKKPLYDGFSLAVEPGERVALSAPSGTGKTTLCRLLSGYERPWKGEVLVDGSSLPERGACQVQLVGQHPELAVDPRMRMSASLREAGLREGEDRAEQLLDRLGIRREWLSRFPHELSGGELQRFCIARALAVDPRYLIADEISTMLDAVTQACIWRVVLEEAQERSMGVVMVSHSPALTKRIATRVVDLGLRSED